METHIEHGGDGVGPAATAADVGTTGRRATAMLERAAERAADHAWRRLRRRPYLGVAAAGAAGIALASAVGIAELAVGVFAAYAAYGILVKKEPPSQALRDAAKIERDVRV